MIIAASSVYMVSCPVLTDPPPPWYGGGVGTRIRYTHCISTLCRLSTLPQYYKPPPHHRGGGILYTTTIPQTTPTPQGVGESFTTTPHGGGGGGDRPTLHHISAYTYLVTLEEKPWNAGAFVHVVAKRLQTHLGSQGPHKTL